MTDDDNSSQDTLSRFLIERTNVRGEVVHLDRTWRSVLARRDYPPAVRQLLGEAMGAVALMSATIKFAGSLILQIRGDGPVHMLVVQATADHAMRGLARWRGDVSSERLADLVGSARMVITIDPGDPRRPGRGMERYQSIIELGGPTLAGALDDYFRSSEQLPTRFWLAADEVRCAGMLLQRLPSEDPAEREAEPAEDETWTETLVRADTVREEELLGLPSAILLRRLFAQSPVRFFEARPYRFECTCSRAGIEPTLRALGRGELESTLAEEGEIRVECEFCNEHYRFDAVDVEQLLLADDARRPGEQRH